MTALVIDELWAEVASCGNRSPEYNAKQMHKVPSAKVIDRENFILAWCRGRVVLDIGASGPMHEGIVAVATKCFGIDRDNGPGILGFNLDSVRYAALPMFKAEITRIVCGEVLEHLSNPGHFLDRLKKCYPNCEVIFSVPNAISDIGRSHMSRSIENVNIDHVAWYSHRTLTTLLSRAGYKIKEFYWYNGKPLFAEGLLVVAV